VPTYSQEDLERIANAIGMNPVEVLQYRNDFEAAGTFYRLNIPPAEREEGPTFELRNQRQKEKNGEKASEQRKTRFKKPKTVSELRKKAKQIEAAAKKLLLHLDIRRLREAPDGPRDGELFDFLASFSGSSEEELADATAKVGRLAELLEGVEAVKTLQACAFKAEQEAAEFAKLLPKGHQGDVAVIGWIADMMSLYKKMTEEEPRFSVLRPGPGRGQPAGRFLRFLQEAGEPLKIDLSPASARSRQRALKGPAQRRQK
jgi:hypothetical protein